jgi:hypothetical protein
MNRVAILLVSCLASSAAAACAARPAVGPAPVAAAGPAPAGPAGCAEEHGADAGDLDAAALIEAGATPGCLAPGDRTDTFMVRAPAHPGGVLYTYRVEVPPNTWVTAELFDGDRHPEGSLISGMGGKTGGGWFVVAPDSVAYLRIAGSSSTLPRPYTLHLAAEPIPDGDEPNDTPATATALALGEPHAGYLSPALNRKAMLDDVYRVEAPRAGTLRIAVADVGPTAGVRCVVTDAAGTQVASPPSTHAGEPLDASVAVRKAGTYFILVSAPGGGQSRGDHEPPAQLHRPYTVTVGLD